MHTSSLLIASLGSLLLPVPAAAQSGCGASSLLAGVEHTPSHLAACSADGRRVVFVSTQQLVPEDTNFFPDVYLLDRPSGALILVSATAAGMAGNSHSSQDVSLSADGNVVAFMSHASDLVPGDSNTWDAIVRDLATGQTVIANRGSSGFQSTAPVISCVLSGNGRYVAFTDLTTGMVPGDTNGEVDVFVRDLQAGTTERVSIGNEEQQANHRNSSPAISHDGRFVAFESWASNLVAGDTNGKQDVFVRDRLLGTTVRVSVSSTGVQSQGHSWGPTLSADGLGVAFDSWARNLAPGDTLSHYDVFFHDLVSGETRRISDGPGGGLADGDSRSARFASSGRHLTFESLATNLTAGGADSLTDVFVHDLLTGETRVASVDAQGSTLGEHTRPTASSHADELVYLAAGSSIVPGVPGGILLTECDTSAVRRYCRAQVNTLGCRPGIDASGTPTASGGGSFVISAQGLLNQKTAILFYGKQGPASSPFRGGVLCVQPPLRRTPTTSTGGNTGPDDCSGTLTFDFDAWVLSGRDAGLVAGQQVHAQFYSRDPNASHGTNLTDAVAFTLAP